jgi:EAL domain-containing protein (putative c-di-GMP-specific phosphodiesterase class I)/GGDEF domain-containing protein
MGEHISLALLLGRHTRLHIMLFRIHDYFLFRELYGDDLGERIDTLFSQAIGNVAKSHGDLRKNAFVVSLAPGEHLLLHDQARADSFMGDTIYSFKANVLDILRQETITLTGRDIELDMGYSVFQTEKEGDCFEKAFFQSVFNAREMADKGFDLENLKIFRELQKTIQAKDVQIVYQPIIDFSDGSILAWEALTRGPRDSCLHSPTVLFDLAEQAGKLFSLENVCREKAVRTIGGMGKGKKMFLNIHPRTVVDPTFAPGRTVDLLREFGLGPENVVFEITERHSIKDFKLFHLTLDHYRNQGFQIAIDDAGTGYSGLSTIAILQPEYIKIDMSLVRDVHKDRVKQALLETMVAFADKIGSKVIAEGVEKKNEAARLREMGMHYGQGYYFGRPVYPKCDTPVNVAAFSLLRPTSFEHLSCSIPIGHLSEDALTVSPDTEVFKVQNLFKQDQSLSGVVICQDQKPQGLVMGYVLDRKLAAPYGHSLYSQRNIQVLMDDEVLIVDENTPVEDIAKLAMARGKMKAYDEIIITSKGLLLGVVSVQKLLNTMAEVQMELAKGTSPLSGLPGNLALERALEDRLLNGRPFSLLYADLDNFKVYNDTYGFNEGDKILLLLSKLLDSALQKKGAGNDALYHVGGDDFVLISHPSRVMNIAKCVARCFGRLSRSCYHREDRERGWILGKDRDGNKRTFPLVSISLGAIDCYDRCSLRELSEQAAAIKKYAKSLPGNSYVRDRRNTDS